MTDKTSVADLEPDTTIDFILEWFAFSRDTAKKMGKRESALLWDDGLKHMKHMAAENAALRAELANERQAAWEAVNKWIKPGPLTGNGCDELAQRNGMILAANLLHERMERKGEA